ncbi:hypothetical protein H0H93_016013 [Arthromyces matolae]|nr:hypothetical protein H0H93_016013 [Arthromyces matolae]
MPNPMLNSRAGRPVGLGRNHDYNAIYEAEPAGQESSENARVWRVYLDEADAYDTDMINSFETILDSLLVFASLFSAVVTTFVAQTSQVLQPDNAQITVSLLVETNQLLRAAGDSEIFLRSRLYNPGASSKLMGMPPWEIFRDFRSHVKLPGYQDVHQCPESPGITE